MRRWWINLLLFLATAVSIFVTSWALGGPGDVSDLVTTWNPGWPGDVQDHVVDASVFTVSVLLILGSHELGHYFMARAHQVDSSLPYFIPVPFLGFGTMGAVIRLRGRVPNRNALVDIGAAGPLAGLAIAVPLLVAGTSLSHVDLAPKAPDPFPPNFSLWSLAQLLGKYIRSRLDGTDFTLPFKGFEIFGDNALTLALTRLLHGPLAKGHELYAHPLFIAAWFGLLVTMLNLMPVGQLDGGHLTHAWFGARAEQLGRHVAAVLLVLALFCSVSWLVWFFAVTRVVGFGHPAVTEPEVPLSRGRKVVCTVCFVFTALCFMPVPLGIL